MTQPNEDGLRLWHFRQLHRSLQALATTAVDQLTLFPELVAKADDLAFDFGHWADTVRNHYGDELSRIPLDALAAIEQKFATMSRDQAEFDAELWTVAALHSSVDWADVRRLAASALEAIAWPGQAVADDGPPSTHSAP